MNAYKIIDDILTLLCVLFSALLAFVFITLAQCGLLLEFLNFVWGIL
jgi:hypothetical protein